MQSPSSRRRADLTYAPLTMQTIRWLLHALVLISFLLYSSDGARPSPPGEILGRPTAASSPVGSGSPAEELVVDTGIIAAGAGSDADVAAPPPPPAPARMTTPAAAVGNRRGRCGDDVLLRRGRSVALVAQLLRHSSRRLTAARRVLATEATATDGSGPSCHSNNMHITCSPPAQN